MAQALTVTTEEALKNLIVHRFLGEPTWLHERRHQAAQQYFSLDWPRLERTPLKKRHLEQIDLLAPLPDAPVIAGHVDRAPVHIHFNNGQVVSCSVPRDLEEQGVILKPLALALDEASVQQYLGTAISDQEDKMTSLTAALWQTGFYLYIPRRLAKPVTVSVEFQATADVTALLVRNLIVCEPESQVIVTERLMSQAGATRMLLSEHTEIVVHEGARVDYGAIQLLSEQVEGFIRRVGQVGHDARLNWNIGEFGANLLASQHVAHLNEPGAATKSVTVFFGSGQQHQDYSAKSYHHAPHTTSDMIARGVMKDRSRSVFTGLTHIDAGARGTDGRQKEQTLMLSDNARADAIPSLIINERDVYAAHAASAGPIDKGALFYLTSRGLTHQEAERMIVHGFLAPVIDAIPLEALKSAVWDAVERKIQA